MKVLRIDPDFVIFEGVAYARYATPQCAAYARDKLNGFEYPIGSQLMVQMAEETTMEGGPAGHHDRYMGRGDDHSDIRQRAASLLEKAGINPHAVMGGGGHLFH